MKACKPAWIVDLQAFLVAGAEGLEPSARGFGAARKPITETI